MAGSRGMVTSLMDTAHKTDTECHEAAITATDKLYRRQDDTMAFRFQLSFSFMRTRDGLRDFNRKRNWRTVMKLRVIMVRCVGDWTSSVIARIVDYLK